MQELLYKDKRKTGNTVLRQCQLVQLHLLHVFDKVCNDNGLQYLLIGGTLIGAMRHNGFIPWDDDLDVGMPMRDYKRFLKIAEQSLPKDVYLDNPAKTAHIAIPFAKIRDAYSFYCEPSDSMLTSDPSGIYIDIFPYEEMPDMPYGLQKLLVKACGSTWMRSRYFYNKARGFLPGLFFSLIGFLCVVCHALVRSVIWVLQRFLPSRFVYLVFERGDTFRYEKALMLPAVKHAFEDGVFPVPNGSDDVLRAQYGNWREIPPMNKRPRHATIIDPFNAVKCPWSMNYP